MLARALSYGLSGIDGFPVTVEVYAAGGLPMLEIIGLPDASIKESRDRVSAAVANSGFQMPVARVTVNLAPADTRKEGPAFDLPIAVCVLMASSQIPNIDLTRTVLIGELSLDGSIQPVRGALAVVISAKEQGISDIILPAGNAAEVACIEGVRVHPAGSLQQVVRHLTGYEPIPAQEQMRYEDLSVSARLDVDLSQVQGQLTARRALTVAVAGGHNMLMIGVPGSGKTMLARAAAGILPHMTLPEAMETTRIHSISGKLQPGTGLMINRPFISPHHTASAPSLVGGGPTARPGDVSLAHNGILFLDELPEFSRPALEALRQPLEDGKVTISRVASSADYPSRFMLIASMNPCPCGYFGSKTRPCRCTQKDIRRYLDRVSGPLLDRIDLQIEVDAVPVNEINTGEPAESSASVAERVQKARAIQQERYRADGIHCNAQLNSKLFKKYCALDPASDQIMKLAVDRMGMSMRAYGRVLKVARTIADLDGAEVIRAEHVSEAIQYRELDGKYWK